MKQVYTSKNGVVIENTPVPSISRGSVLIKVAYSCISAGTEISAVNGASKSLIKRAIDNPQQVKQAFELFKEQGLKQLIGKVDSSMGKISPTGYSVSGLVVGVGEGVDNFRVGDFVSAGGSTANHAEYVSVPKNLVVKIPRGLELFKASVGTVGSIALHGVRRASLSLNENGVVVGCGLMGLLAIQMLKAAGVKVACTDVSTERLNLAKKLGADIIINPINEDPVNAVMNWTNGYGADAVLFTAATHSDEPLSQSFKMCRKKGKVVLLGVSGMNINRADIYKNEIDFCISTSYGPGRYDPNYELKGIDYPYGYVRWTENRNIEAFLELIRDGKISLDLLSPKVYSIEDVAKAYDGIKNSPSEHIVTILDYGIKVETKEIDKQKFVFRQCGSVSKEIINIGLIGAGSFATSVLLPIIKEQSNKYRLKTIVNRSGDKSLSAAREFNADCVSSDENDIFNDPEVDLVVISTRHNSHAELVLKALNSGKNVYVEKPLAINIDQLEKIKSFYENHDGGTTPVIMVGYNRRFSKYAEEIRRHLDNRVAPVYLRYRMNAGYAPSDAWVHGDGGRIIGEACHIIDLMQFLVNRKVDTSSVAHFKPINGMYKSEDNRIITLEFEDGSMAVIEYLSCANKSLPKEWMEVHWEGKSIIMDDYKSLTGYGIRTKSINNKLSQKGHREEWERLYSFLKEGKNPIDLGCLFETTQISILASQE